MPLGTLEKEGKLLIVDRFCSDSDSEKGCETIEDTKQSSITTECFCDTKACNAEATKPKASAPGVSHSGTPGVTPGVALSCALMLVYYHLFSLLI